MIAKFKWVKRPSRELDFLLRCHFQSHQWKCEVKPLKSSHWESGNSSKRDFLITSAKDVWCTADNPADYSHCWQCPHSNTMGADSADHHCAKGYMCHMVDTSLLRGVMEKSINHQWKLNGIVKDAHQKKMTLWFVWLLSREGNREISKVFIPQVTLIHPLPCGNVVLMMGVELENSCQAPLSVHAFCLHEKTWVCWESSRRSLWCASCSGPD